MNDNILTTIEQLFQSYYFKIPKYQRSYAWEEKQLETFVEDLRHQISAQKDTIRDDAKKPYFFGTLLLHAHQDGHSLNIVDGQQRLTTTIIFIATALQQLTKVADKEMIEANYINNPEFEQKFITIDKDNSFFRSAILCIDESGETADTHSSQRLLFARDYFIKNILENEWQPMVEELRNAQVLSYVIDNLSTATQIFEFQNDRGKDLTNLETLKSFLMHNVHLYTKGFSDTKISSMHQNFEAIFRDIETLAEYPRSPDEDSILSYHCAAYLQWNSIEYQHPKAIVKKQIKAAALKGSAAIVAWIDQFIIDLKQSYKNVLEIYKKLDEYTEFSHLLVLNRLAAFWPLLIKSYKADTTADKQAFRKVCHLMEVFSFRAYGLANVRANTGTSHLIWMAKEFDLMNVEPSFEWVDAELKRLCNEWGIAGRMKESLNNAWFYHNQKSAALYILWRYENYLRDGNKKQNQWPKLSWRVIVSPQKYAEKLSIEHIAAQNHDMSNTIINWDGNEPVEFKDAALHRLGNLVIDSISSNSSKSDDSFDEKWKRFAEGSTYLSQGELKGFVKNKTWDVDAIKNRQRGLIEFVQKNWEPTLA